MALASTPPTLPNFFAAPRADASLASLQWQCSDVAANLDAIAAWRANAGTLNFLPPVELDLAKRNFPVGHYDFIYTANTLHIVSWQLVQAFCDCVANCLVDGGKLFIYGPFNYDGAYTSQSNAQFDASLRARDPHSGIRDFEAICTALAAAGHAEGSKITLAADIAMPANNRLLVFDKAAAGVKNIPARLRKNAFAMSKLWTTRVNGMTSDDFETKQTG